MTDSFQKDIVQDSDYTKYLAELKKYYNKKKEYTYRRQRYINSIISKDLDMEAKKKLIAKYVPTCVDCGEAGGTVFTETSNTLRATCGHTTKQCKFNIDIVKMRPSIINSDLAASNVLLNNKKRDIVKTKLDFLFKYIDEEKAVELFQQHNNDRQAIESNYNNLLLLYNSIVNNPETEKLLNEKLEEHNALVDEHKQFIKLYKVDNETQFLKDAVLIYTDKLQQLNNIILNLKYKHNSIEFDDDMKYLHQYKYILTDLELIKKPN